MANLIPTDASGNEGSVGWSIAYAPGGSPTLTNDSAHAADGSKSLKIVSAASGQVKIQTADIAVGAGVTLTTERSVGFASAGGLYVAAYIDFFNGGSYLTTFVLDNNGNANTSAFDVLPDTSVTPGSTTKMNFGFDITFTGAGQIIYIDKVLSDDGTGGGGGGRTRRSLLVS